ncbi:MAG: methyltransferase domain-containing protein [Cyclobacteriaceae bacterium]|nr:methyltransferase domain-containing protein [Cyclobacteriaceae bacterium]
MATAENYELNYSKLPFEGILRRYRQRNIQESLNRHVHKNILEIGCGEHPIFQDFDAFDKMVVVEPGDIFYERAVSLASNDERITIYHGLFENILDQFKDGPFDYIIIGGFLHEIDNPDEVLKRIKEVCHTNTIVHSFVPNAKSFHRLLAYEAGLIQSIYEESKLDALFGRRTVYDVVTFSELFELNGFSVIEKGSYFIKPFTHHQMEKLLSGQIIESSVLDGLNKMSAHFPDNGAEIYISAKPVL